MKTLATGLFIVLAGTSVSREAAACGGLFCDRGPGASTVIDQTAERIVFTKQEVNGRDKVRAYIQIRYQGDPVDFAWVVPVVARPELDVADPQIFNALDLATAPTFIFENSTISGGGGGGFGCMGSSREEVAMGGDGGDEDLEADGVNVWSSENIGPYSTAVISAKRPEDLTGWLETHEYSVPDEANGIIGQYVEEGFFFVAIRLRADAGVDLIQPLVIEYEGAEPCVPLRLTQVAAQPDMGVLLWVIADSQAYPYNYARASVDDRQVVQNQDGTTNYLDLVSDAVDAAGNGRAFVTEFAAETSTIPDLSSFYGNEAEEIVRSNRYITRLYTQIDPQEMTLDPVFELDPDLADVSNVHDLSRADATAGIAAPAGGATAALLGAGLPVAVVFALLVSSRRKR